MPEIRVSVRDLVAFCHRSGHIDHRFTPSPTAQQGIEGHQRIYRRRPATYVSEYPVEHSHRSGDLELLVRGRADGYDPAIGLVEEIKTCRVAVEDIPETVSSLHLAQARVYAAIIAAQEKRDRLDVRLTWLNIDTGEEHCLGGEHRALELEHFLAGTMERFAAWLQLLGRLRRERDSSLETLAFPHGEFRPGQRDIAELVYKCVDQGGELMVEAPTGIGKTAAVMYPALMAMGRGKHEGLVFATARTVGRRAAEDAMALMADSGLRATGLSLTAKDKICFSPGHACHWGDCPYANGYYDRLPPALEEAITAPALRRQDVERIARVHDICPYQLADDLLPWVDIVIADLHYLFSLYPRLGYLMEQGPRRFSVLVDEAHNLPERARGMYSASLVKRNLMQVKRDAPDRLRKSLERVNGAMLELQRQDWEDREDRRELPSTLLRNLADFVAVMGEELAMEPHFSSTNARLMEFYFDVLHWLRVAEHWGEEFLLELERGQGTQGLRLTLNCLDPSRLLREAHQRSHALVAFSATLSPPDWMASLLGLEPGAVRRCLESPFSPEQLQVTLDTRVDTRYQSRQQSLAQLAAVLQDWLDGTQGNSIVYFPSYRYLQDCLALVTLQRRRVWQQHPEQGEKDRGELLTLLAERRDVAAFCILGGVFGEGIDLPGEQLTGVAVVGVGLPQVGREREQLRDWYQRSRGAGFEYAYLYPGMQKVAQALGRVVRTEQDQGRALLVDSRYARREYRDLLPPWWTYSA